MFRGAGPTVPSSSSLWLLLAGLSFLFAPTFMDLLAGLWQSEEQSHAPLVLGIGLWLIWCIWVSNDANATAGIGDRRKAMMLLVVALLLYVPGRAFSLVSTELIGFLLALASCIALLASWRMVRRLLFPFLFLLFIIPVPNSIMAPIASALQLIVSKVVVGGLHALGYPVARSGVIIGIGQYQLFVADACSGLRTIFSLGALGLLYLYLTPRRGTIQSILLCASIPFIALAANIVRVLMLVLITFHLGDGAGQGFMHESAGILLFIIALLLLLTTDSILRRLLPGPRPDDGRMLPLWVNRVPRPGAIGIIHIGAVLAMLASGVAAFELTPRVLWYDVLHQPNFSNLVPKRFGEWQGDSDDVHVVVDPQQGTRLGELYAQTVTRRYRRQHDGREILMSLAYGMTELYPNQLHMPEWCYSSQGFAVSALHSQQVDVGVASIPARALLANGHDRREQVMYWIRIGDRIEQSWLGLNLGRLRMAAKGYIADGLLFRISEINSDPTSALQLESEFVSDLLGNLSPDQRQALVGHRAAGAVLGVAGRERMACAPTC